MQDVERTDDGVRLRVRTTLAGELAPGDSVAVNGVCLTAVGDGADGAFAADVVQETLRRSSLERLASGGRVNLELPLRATDRLGGHVVQGHVDGVGRVARDRATRASPSASRSRPAPSSCATSSRRARSPSTASR